MPEAEIPGGGYNCLGGHDVSCPYTETGVREVLVEVSADENAERPREVRGRSALFGHIP
jgi:hypothetical protein